MIRVVKICGEDFTYAELREMAKKATDSFGVKRVILPVCDPNLGKVVDVLLLCGGENFETLD